MLDSVGIGESPDAHLFGDVGADTLGHIGEAMKGLHMPNMAKLGLSNIRQIKGVPVEEEPHWLLRKNAGSICRKRYDDRTLGNHGLNIDKPFKVYPNGFPKELIDRT